MTSSTLSRQRLGTTALEALDLARQEAIRHGARHVTTHHLLIGMALTSGGQCIAAQILKAYGLTLEALRETLPVETHRDHGIPRPGGDLHVDIHHAQALHKAEREADMIGHHWVEAAHLLLALSRDEGATGTVLLRQAGLNSQLIARHLVQIANGRPMDIGQLDPQTRRTLRMQVIDAALTASDDELLAAAKAFDLHI